MSEALTYCLLRNITSLLHNRLLLPDFAIIALCILPQQPMLFHVIRFCTLRWTLSLLNGWKNDGCIVNPHYRCNYHAKIHKRWNGLACQNAVKINSVHILVGFCILQSRLCQCAWINYNVNLMMKKRKMKNIKWNSRKNFIRALESTFLVARAHYDITPVLKNNKTKENDRIHEVQ